MTTDLILGTAGHIDHGKTSLVRALTGMDTDRLPEERRRGITIDLGFAELLLGDFRLGIVDVPGHERFVRNMLAGATGIDLAMLMVAADDVVKPQTREHLEILRLLNLDAGVIAVTKCDLAEPDWLTLVEDEIRELVRGSFLEQAPIVRTSAQTGQGLDALREELAAAAARVADSPRMRRIDGPFRLAIDRAFTMAGHGTVVTGSVSSGRVRLGDELAVEPGAVRVRVRGLQNHDRPVDEVHRGQRAAINLAGVHHDALRRGQELCSPGHLVPSRLLSVQFALLDSAVRPLRNRARIRVHVGTAELLASVRLIGMDRLEPGDSAAAQVFLSQPAVTVWSQPLVIRSESPVVTLGGGVVLDPSAERIRKSDSEAALWIRRLASADTAERASAALYFAGLRDWQPASLPRTAGVHAVDAAVAQLRERGELLEIPISPTRTFRLHRRVFERLCERVAAALGRVHERFPLRTVLERSLLAHIFRYLGDNTLLQAALKSLQAQGTIRADERGVALVGHGPRLSQNERKLLSQLVEMFREAGVESPSVQECQKQTPRNQSSVPQLLALAAENGDLVTIAPDYYLHADVERQTRDALREKLAGGDGLTLSQIRELLGTTRKYAVPLCEYLDRIGFTQRKGDLRFLASRASE